MRQGIDGLAGAVSAAGDLVRGRRSAGVEEAVLRRRKQLLEQGLDHGPQSIVWALRREGLDAVPSRSTVWRILTRHGADHAAAAETPEVSDETILSSPGPMNAGNRTGRNGSWPMDRWWPSPAASMTTPAT